MEVDDRDQPEREWQQQKEAELQGSAAARHQEEMQRLAGLQRFAQAEAELRRRLEEEAAARLYEEAIAARHQEEMQRLAQEEAEREEEAAAREMQRLAELQRLAREEAEREEEAAARRQRLARAQEEEEHMRHHENERNFAAGEHQGGLLIQEAGIEDHPLRGSFAVQFQQEEPERPNPGGRQGPKAATMSNMLNSRNGKQLLSNISKDKKDNLRRSRRGLPQNGNGSAAEHRVEMNQIEQLEMEFRRDSSVPDNL